MPSNHDARLGVAWKLLESDLAFATRFVSSGQRHQKLNGLAVYGMLPHLSMICYEMVKFLRKQHPELASQLATQSLGTIRNSRNVAKHLDDGRQDAPDVVAAEERFKAEIISHYRRQFAPPSNLLGRLFHRLYKDLGLYYYDGVLVATTHSAGYNLGMQLIDLNSEEARAKIDTVSFELGQLMNTMGHGLDRDAKSFLDFLDPGKIAMRDVHSADFYTSSTRESSARDELVGLHALIRLLQTDVSFLDTLTPLESDTESIITLAKFRLVSCIHVVASSRRILRERGEQLDGRTAAALYDVAHRGESELILTLQIRKIRNTLVHYMPDRDFKLSDYNDQVPLGGIVEKYSPGLSFIDIGALAYRETGRIASVLTKWGEA